MLISNAGMSRKPEYLPCEYSFPYFLGATVKNVLYIPYAVGTDDIDGHVATAAQRFEVRGYNLTSIHTEANPASAIQNAEAIFVGDGNAWLLLYALQHENLLTPLYAACLSGVPYIGIGAGALLACPTISTTNDFAVVDPPSVNALGVVPFQIVTNFPDRHTIEKATGRTAEDDIRDFHTVHKTPVVGLRAGSWIHCTQDTYLLEDRTHAKLFFPNSATEWQGAELNGQLMEA